MIEQLKNIEINTKENLEDFLRENSKMLLATNKEKNEWPYKNDLTISPNNLLGKKLFENNKEVGVVSEINYRKHKGRKVLKLTTEYGEYSLTNCAFEFDNSLYDEKQIVDLHPSRKGKKFWSLGYILSESDYKSLYYKTKDYRDGYEKSLNDNLGTTGLRAPIQSKKIKDKISKTMEDKYGVKWFLERGNHYSAVTITMQDKFGVDNLFKDSSWQIENSKKVNKNLGQSSNLERDIIKELEYLGLNNSFYNGSSRGQKVVILNKNKFYKLDYYNSNYNVVVEVMGDYWHCNPMIYEHSFYHKNKKKLASEIWKDDRKRKNEIINTLKCNYIEVWEKDWNNNKENILMYIKSQIEVS